jgi:intein/homing endonuclease
LVTPSDLTSQLEAYRSWVYVCASKNAISLASFPLKLYVAKPSKSKLLIRTKSISKETRKHLYSIAHLDSFLNKAVEIEEVLEHPFLNMMKNVNPFTNSFELKEITDIHQELTGNSYWYIISNYAGMPVELWIIPPDKMRIIPSKEEFISGYLYNAMPNSVAFTKEQIIHFKFSSPLSPYYGLSPLAAITHAYNINENMNRYENALFTNMGRPDGVLETDDFLNDDDFKKLKKEWKQTYGRVKNSGKTAVLDMGIHYKPISFPPRELSFLAGRKTTKEEICFKPRTKIITKDGLKEIQNIEIGDMVLTHKGEFNKVLKMHKRHYQDILLSIKAKGLDKISVTPNHPFLTIEGTYESLKKQKVMFDEKYKWKEIKDIRCRQRRDKNSNHYKLESYDNLALPKIKEGGMKDYDLLQNCKNENIMVGNNYLKINNGNAKKIKRYIDINKKFGKLIGYFLAEGSTGQHQSIFYFHKKEIGYCKEVKNIIKELFGLESSIILKKEYNVRFVRNSSKILTDFFKQFGNEAPNKKMPSWIFDCNKDFWQGIIEGLVNGDGCVDKKNTRLTTSSIYLAWQVRILLLTFDKYASIVSRRNSDSFLKKGDIAKNIYTVGWYPNSIKKSFGIGNKYFKTFIKEKEYEFYYGNVYNLEVENDNSYVTTGGIVHNCK